MKLVVVAGGYVAAVVIALVTVWVRNLSIDPAVALASSGMYAFGDALLFVGVFGLLSLIPTGAGLSTPSGRTDFFGRCPPRSRSRRERPALLQR
jgi:hypothetical protein